MTRRQLAPSLITRRTLFTTAGAAIIAPAARAGSSLRVSVAEFPDPISTPAIIEALTIAFAKLPNLTVSFATMPFARSMASVAAGLVDLHVPMIRPSSIAGLDWSVTTATVYHVPFVLYTHKDTPIDRAELGRYRIETDVAHVGYFDFPVVGSAGVESSLRKVAGGRIDGYVYAGNIADPLVEKFGLQTIHREWYRTFDASGVLPKGGANGAVDRLMSAAMGAAADDQDFKAAIRKVLSGYRGDWQP